MVQFHFDYKTWELLENEECDCPLCPSHEGEYRQIQLHNGRVWVVILALIHELEDRVDFEIREIETDFYVYETDDVEDLKYFYDHYLFRC